ncbi:SIR2 family protein [Paraburkholderia sp. SIMBA_049]
MTCSILLGAGFSRNWGGWLGSEAFEYLLGCPGVGSSPTIKDLLWRFNGVGGFESALAELQGRAKLDPERHATDLRNLEAAIGTMFKAMDYCMSRLANFDLGLGNGSVRKFLGRFDAIFTLNQDLLLEYQYLQRWDGVELPGMRLSSEAALGPCGIPWTDQWVPAKESEFRVTANRQPCFKLHGSSNWVDRVGGSLLMAGGENARELGLFPILDWYHRQFAYYVSRPGHRLMTIGYGFRDIHINDVIAKAVTENGLQLFVIAPEGSDAAANATLSSGDERGGRTVVENAFRHGLIGASRRPLTEIFGERETLELKKIWRFLDS